jgi:hypothetical protein
MPVLLIIFGLLLMLFGGGCTLIVGGLFISDSSGSFGDLGSILPMWLGIGVAPLVGGYFMFRAGLSKDRERRKTAQTPPSTGDKA